jgi:AraC-like DNA-binding protein
VALVLNATDRATIRESLKSLASVEFCARTAELFRLVSDGGADAVIAEPHDVNGRATAPVLHSLSAGRPRLQVVLYLKFSRADVREAVEGWASAVVFTDQEDIGSMLRTALVRAPHLGSPGATLATTAALVPPEVRRFFIHCAWRATRVGSARAAAEGVGISYRTLAKQLEEAGLPTPKVILSWYQLLHAAWRAELSHAGREAVANDVGFSSGDVLAKALRRYADISWTELREWVGFSGLLARFEALIGAQVKADVKSPDRATPPESRSRDRASPGGHPLSANVE